MGANTVVFGAGATKACGGPMTAEILPQAYDTQLRAEIEREGLLDMIKREGYADLLEEFLVQNFHLPNSVSDRKNADYPALPLLLSLIDTAIDRKQPFGPEWLPERILDKDQSSSNGRRSLIDVRQALEYLIFALLDYKLRNIQHNYYDDLLEKLYSNVDTEPTVISLNYDIIADNSLIKLNERWRPDVVRFPHYGCDIRTEAYRSRPHHFGTLLKLHGSLNWTYCPGCHRLDLGISKGQRSTVKVLEQLYIENNLEARYSCRGSECPDCGVFVRPVLITPTYLKDYRNPHIAQIWYQAENVLRMADHVIFIGYSLPDDDVNVIYLLKRSLARRHVRITVVEYDTEKRALRNHPVGMRYKALFGDRIEWNNDGFAQFVSRLSGQTFPAFAGSLY